jgi:hypothetical protein
MSIFFPKNGEKIGDFESRKKDNNIFFKKIAKIVKNCENRRKSSLHSYVHNIDPRL